MAGAEIIGAAIGVLLLVLVGYIMVGSTLTSAEIVASAQKDLTMQNEARLRTAIEISDITIENQASPSILLNLKFNLKNSGNEMIGDFNHMDVYVTPKGFSPIYHKLTTVVPSAGVAESTWGYISISPDVIHPTMLDPDETMLVEIDGFNSLLLPLQITMITPNGAQATKTKLT
ncbi:MAG: hypothetical protein NTY71_04500 [Methanoregula sp.]|nr:hypothetical protein [Methanoregula sp.]